MWSAYRDNDAGEPVRPNRDAAPGTAPPPAPGTDPVELAIDGETFVVTRRANTPNTYDFDWTSHPASYGFTVSMNTSWQPDREELTEHVRSFLAEIDPATGYLAD